MLSDDEIRKLFGDRVHFQPAQPQPAPVFVVSSLSLPYPLTLGDVRAVYTLAYNCIVKDIPKLKTEEGRTMMAKAALDSIRFAAGIEACIHVNLHSDPDDEQPQTARG